MVDGARGGWPFLGRGPEAAAVGADLADPHVVAVVLTAPAGAGKTRLVRELTGRAEGAALWWQATAAVADVPFGALAGLLPTGADATPATAHAALAEQVAAGGGLVVVDDAPHLDARSADLLRRLVDAGGTTVLATARRGTPLPAHLEWLWAHEGTRHHGLGPLTVDTVAALADAVLADLPAEDRARVAVTVAARSGGNALFVRELLREVRRSGDPAAVDLLPDHLRALLDVHHRAAGPAAVTALQAVALVGALPVDLLVGRAGADAVDAATQADLLVIDDGPPATARAAHPLHAEAALAAVAPARRTDLVADLATAVLGHPATPGPTRLAAVALLLRQGTPPPLPDLVAAARAAFAALDHGLATELARGAIAAGDRFEARLVLGAALSGAGDRDGADAALADALAAAGDDDERARAAGRLSVHLVAHGARLAEADALLAEVEADLVDPAARAFVAADRAKLATIRGEVVVPPAADGTAATGGVAALNAAIVGAYAHAMRGDAGAARAVVTEALPLAEEHRSVLPWAADLVRFSGPFAALVAEGPSAAAAEARAGATAEGSEPSAVGTWRFLHGFMAALAGRLATARTELAGAADALVGHDLVGARPLALSAQAWAAAQAGAVDEARALLDNSVLSTAVDGRARTQVAVADAWCDRVEGRPTVAASKLVAAARQAADEGQVVAALVALHELVRLGAADEALAPLRRLVDAAPPSWLADFVHDRAEAEARGDGAALARLAQRAAGRWPVAGVELHAARARTTADPVEAARATVAALVAARGLDGPRPTTVTDLAWPLTDRERHVAEAVAAGASNRAVAEADGLSVRTVENQLQSVYRKLGLRGRGELAALLRPPVRDDLPGVDPRA